MADHKIVDNKKPHADSYAFGVNVSLRDDFLDWLIKKYPAIYTPYLMVNCLDSISEYAQQKKIIEVDLWNISQHDIFFSLYKKIINNNLLSTFNRSTHNVFRMACQLYLKFLKDKPAIKDRSFSHEEIKVENTERLVTYRTATSVSAEKHSDVIWTVDFAHPDRCAQTRPVTCLINGQAILFKKKNWSRLLVAITEHFIAEENPNLGVLEKKPLYGSKIFFTSEKPGFGNCHKLSNGKWVYTNYSPQTIVKITGNLCRHCGVNLNDVVINYLPKEAPFERSVGSIKRKGTNITMTAPPKKTLNPALAAMITKVLITHFPNGFRSDSPIELMRFRRFASKRFYDDISITDEELVESIVSCGIFFSDKVYVIGRGIEDRIRSEIDSAVSAGSKIIFYSSFYTRHEEWLFPGNIISEEMLKDIIIKLYPKYIHRSKYFSRKVESSRELAIIKNEIMRIWGGDIALNYEQLAARLPYIPLDKIKFVLAQNENFIWNTTEIYTHVGMVDITDEERTVITSYVAEACRTDGYASLSDLPLSEMEERHGELALTAIQKAVFEIILSGKYDRRGKIITRRGDTLDAFTIMKEHCRTIDKCTYRDLLDFCKELLGGTRNYSMPMEAAYSVMVRADKDNFVAEKYFHFDTVAIDNILDLFVISEYLPLKSITTFAAFPHCGYLWNLFLLESYCRRFSNIFRFDAPTANSRNVGAIIRKNSPLTYKEIMIDAVIKSGIALDKKAIGKFLYKAGYIGKSTTAKATEIIEKAKVLRERGY